MNLGAFRVLYLVLWIAKIIESNVNTIVVDNVEDTMPPLASYCDLPTAGNCNLRSAWLACSDQQDPCEILLPQDAYVSMNSAYGSLILLNGMEVIIHGQNATVFPILQSLQFITYFSSGSGDSPTLQLNQLNIMNFGTPYGSGGSISINNDCSLTLDNVSFLNSHANEGGAIYITDNSKPSRISNSFFYNCSSLIDGGAIEIYRVSALTIEDSTFENCLAQEGGGAVSARVDNERISILNSKFRGCSTTSVYGNGGAVEYFGSREMLISGSNFTDCHSQVNAGAISVNDGNVNTTLQHNTFEGCSAQINGGAIYVFLNNINTTISHSVFTNCGAKQSAGAIGFCNGNRDTTVVNVSIDNCYTGLGGGLGVDTHLGEFLLSESIFSGCISQYGGGLSVTQSDRITVLDTTIHDCMSFNSGGGMYLSKVDGVQISGSAVVNCFAQFSGGGAIFAAAVPVFVVNDTLINNCQAFGENGGGIKLHESVVTIAHSMVQNCSAAQGGGLYFVNANDSLIQDSAFLYNTASDVGGGIYLSYMDDLTFLNTSVVSNRAVTGAGVYVGPKNVRIAFGGLVARNNFALQYGGGVYFGSNVPNLIVTDTKTATNTVTLQTDHPYAYNVQNSPSTTLLYQQFEVSGGAIGFAISFDPRCSIRDGDSLQIYAGQVLDTSEVFSATAGTAYPGVDSPSLMLFDTLVIVEFTGYYDYSPYAYGYYGLKMYVTPIYSRVDYPSLMDSNRALYGGGMYMYQRLLAPFFLNAKFANNVATNGGGMYMYSDITYLTMYGVAFLANEATKNGGGVYMNKDILQVSISNLYLAENTAMGSGGGMFIYSDVGGNISDSSFVANTASFGGGLTLQTTQVSLDLNRIEFSHNHAVSGSGGGGAVAFLSNNGDFSSEQVYRIALQGCVYSNNTAISGGAVYANADNVITFVSSTFSLNSATNGAGMYLNSQNSFLLHNITFNGNVAEKGGGGIMSLDSNNIGISSSTLQANQATAGGGMFVSGGTTVAFESTTLHSNVASEVGGAMASVSSPMFTVAEGGVLSLSGNSAHRGSALFFQSLLSGGAIANTEFIGNMAQVGGTVYWLYDPTMNQEPVGLDSVSNSWAGNTAPYGVRSATQALQLHGPQQYTLTAYLQALTPPIVLTLTDYYNQPIPLTDSTSVVPSIHTTDEHLCEPGHPTISGNDILGVIFDQGNATFGKMQAFCYPGGSVTLYFTAQLGDQIDSIPTSVSQSYYLKTSTHVSFRPCVMGEIIRNDACVPCPAWSYSLASTVNADTNCVSCGSTDGIAICQANKITLTGGYWRRFDTSVAVQACPAALSGCKGGTATGNGLCKTGFEGPLCAVCADGFFQAKSECLSCSGPHELPLETIMLVVAVAICFVIFAGYLYCRFHQLRHVAKMSRRSDNKTDLRLSAYNFIDRVLLWFASRYRSIIVKLKIIVATYQIITAVPNVLSVTMPSSFTSFLHGMNFVNLSFVSLLSLQCSSHFNFIDKLIISTLVPIGIVLLLFVAFVLHIVYIAKEVNKNPHRKVGDARALYDAAKDQYLNYFFYLTYLILPSVTTRIFQTFLCTNIDPDNENPDDDNYYLTADMSISCSSAYYHRGVAYAIFMIFVYPIGITSMYAYLLYTHHVEIRDRQLKTEERRGLLDPPSDVESPDTGSDTMNNSPSAVELEAGRGSVIQHTDNPMLMSTVDNSKRAEEAPQTEDRSDQSRPERTVSTATSIAGVSTSGRSNRFGMSAPAARLAFLWGAYEPVYWYWELIETSRRLMLTAVLSATGAGTSKQAVLALLLALMYIKLYAYFSPYEQTPSNTTAEIGQYQILFSFLGALVVMESLLGSGYNSTVGGLLILFNLGVVTAFSYYEIRDLLAERAEEREANDEKIARSSDVVNVSSGGASNDVEIEMTDVANDN